MTRTFEELKKDFKFKDYINRLFLNKASEFQGSQIFEIEVTNKCSIGCFYCGASTENKEIFLDLDLIKQAIKNFIESCEKASAEPVISITGGDPLEYPFIDELIELLTIYRLRFTLKLNPSTIRDHHFKIITASTCESVKLTFMGIETQEKVRRKDTIEKLTYATDRFLKKNIKVIWHFSLGEFNREDLSNSLDFVLEKKPSAVSIGRLAKIGRLKEKKYPDEIQPFAYRNFLKQVFVYFYNNKRNGFNLVFKDKLWIPFLCEEAVLSETDMLKPGIRLGCDAGERLKVLTFKGELLGCGLLPDHVLSDVDSPDFFEILKSTDRTPLYLSKDGCEGCKFIEICRGCRGVASTTFNNKDPQCWL